jgi:hypothetical protein
MGFVADPAPGSGFVPDDPNFPGGSGHILTNQELADKFKYAVTRLPSQFAHAATDVVTAIPNMAGDLLTAGHNVVDRATGGKGDYAYPSQQTSTAEDQLYGAPQSGYERAGTALSSILLGAGGASESAPNAIRSLVNPVPTVKGAGNQPVPESFVTPDQANAQQLAAALKNFQSKGYVVPPATTNPTVKNQLIETLGSKVGTQQRASLINADIATQGVKQDLGLSASAPLTAGAIKATLAQAGNGMNLIKDMGPMAKDAQLLEPLKGMRQEILNTQAAYPGTPAPPILAHLDSIINGPQTVPTDATIGKIRNLRDLKSAAYASGDGSLGRQYGTLADALENNLDRNAQARAAAGDPTITPDIVQRFRDSRKLYAQAKNAQDAFDESTGKVSLEKLRQMYDADEPLSGNMLTSGQFASSYRKAAQDPSKIGSAGVNHLEGGLTGLAMIEGANKGYEHFGVPGLIAGLAGGAAIPMARRGAMNYALGGGQRGVIPAAESVSLTPMQQRTAALVQALQTPKKFSDQFPQPAPAY